MRATYLAVILTVVGSTTTPIMAQEIGLRASANPFQEGFTYRVGEELIPNVDVDGVRWRLVQVATKRDKQITPGKEVAITVDLELQNARSESAEVLVVLLLENSRGDPLDRLPFDSIQLRAGQTKKLRNKLKVPADTLLATRGLYLFLELQK
jgi:hypothetical protein